MLSNSGLDSAQKGLIIPVERSAASQTMRARGVLPAHETYVLAALRSRFRDAK